MTTKLIMVEGLPGSGKTTIAQIVHELLNEFEIENNTILEGNLDHPADYDGVAYLTEDEFNKLLIDYSDYKGILEENSLSNGNEYFVSYAKMLKGGDIKPPKELLGALFSKDIYELPFEVNRNLIADKWKKFNQEAKDEELAYIFECNFIQNPVTIGLIKYNRLREENIRYVLDLENAVKDLKPLLIYVQQEDIEHSFRKAVKERPREWSEGFVNYYTNQGYGKKHDYQGIEGTIEVLKARRELEKEIFNRLSIDKIVIDNSAFNRDEVKDHLRKELQKYMKIEA